MRREQRPARDGSPPPDGRGPRHRDDDPRHTRESSRDRDRRPLRPPRRRSPPPAPVGHAEWPPWYVCVAALVLGVLTALIAGEVQAQVQAGAAAAQQHVAPAPCVSAGEVTGVLDRLGHTDYWPRMRELGLDRLDIISAASQQDAAAAGIKPYHWMRIVIETNAALAGKRGGPVPKNAFPIEEPEPPVAAPVAPPEPPATPAPTQAVNKTTPAPPVNKTTPVPAAQTPPPPPPTPEPTISTEVVLPPEGTQQFYGLPEGQILPDHALTAGRPTVTCAADNGLGDRLGSLFDAVWLAYVLDAHFHMLWNMNNECRARFGLLFQFNGTHASLPDNGSTGLETALANRTKDFDAIITLGHHRGTAHLVDPKLSTKNSPGVDKPWYSHTARPISLETTSELVQWAKQRQKKGLRVHILHHSDRLAQGVTLENIKKAMNHFKFKLATPIWNRVNAFTRKHEINPQSTVGIHLRATDARIPLMMDVVLSDVRQRFTGRRFFVCSDDKAKEEEFMSAFPGKVVRNTFKTSYPTKLHGKEGEGWRISGVRGSGRFNVERGEPSVIDALTDMAILSRTEKPVIKGVLRDSSFGKMSTTLCIIGVACDEALAALAAKTGSASVLTVR
eukprot:TRINITY_DN3666_c0_g3_i1.p1 TRINITY_DN3666_c0_g3~~TRINITY_DN3666_c0_g3_i1.p1  ORF type:complete len:642 (+),score=231.73 TRINITY_DN3666_c0_g3_i1:77-1927(+)